MFVFLFIQMNTFLSAFLGAMTFYILSRNFMHYLVERRKWRRNLAAAVILIISFLVVLLPVWLFINIIGNRIGYVISNSNKIVSAVETFIGRLETRLGFDILQSGSSNITSTITSTLQNILSATLSSLTSVLLMYFILYFMLVGSKQLEKWMFEFLPLKKENIQTLSRETGKLIVSNAIGIPLVAILQGGVGVIAYFIANVTDVWFWFIFTCISSMIPFVGAALAFVSLSIVLLVQHQTWQGIFILAYGFIVIGSVDNIFRFMLQKKLGDVHPLVTVFGVIIGINLFGFIGIIFGPILISLFIILVKIYVNEFSGEKIYAPTEIQNTQTF